MAKSVLRSNRGLEWTIRAVEGQFGDISDESQVEEMEVVKFGSIIPLEDEVLYTKDTGNIEILKIPQILKCPVKLWRKVYRILFKGVLCMMMALI